MIRFAPLLLLLTSCASTAPPAQRHTAAMTQVAIGGGLAAVGTVTAAQAGLHAAVEPTETTTTTALCLVAAAELGIGAALLYFGGEAATDALDELATAKVKP